MTDQPTRLWQPDAASAASTRIAHYMGWLAERKLHPPGPYEALWQWSVDDLEGFWQSIVDYFGVRLRGDRSVTLGSQAMPGAQWFPHAQLNYCEQVFAAQTPDSPAIIACREDGRQEVLPWADLRRRVALLAQVLREAGVGPGDRVASYLPNWSETVVAFLATASLGAVWSSCAPDMGAGVVADRFAQIGPKVLVATDSYRYGGRLFDRRREVQALLEQLPSVQLVLHVPGPHCEAGALAPWHNTVVWGDALAAVAARAPELSFEPVPFGHPLWVVYSSGTTGLPKAMVHSHGGIALTHLKTMALQHDLRAHDRMLFLGSPGWIVWNLLVGGLLTGATIVLFDGNPQHQGPEGLWRLLDSVGVTHLGCGAAYLTAVMNAGTRPRDFVRLQRLRAIVSTGSPLVDAAYHWVYAAVKPEVWLASVSGGTDIASGFVACCPLLPVHAGEIQCRELGVAAQAFDEQGRAVVGEVGELVVTRPMPSMPVYFWNDPDGSRYRDSYFETWPGVWRHGDWIRFTERGTSVIYGRSDATINRHGIRMGTAEIYRAVELLPWVRDSLVVDLEYLGRPSFLPLFVVLADGEVLGDDQRAAIVQQVRTLASPRHVPDAVLQVDAVPRTLTGKKMEVPLRKLLLGAPVESVARADAMANPESLAFFVRYAQTLAAQTTGTSAT
ncbi:MAG: acetoacetate--CoA ligase [Pseudomonadota bacterium]